MQKAIISFKVAVFKWNLKILIILAQYVVNCWEILNRCDFTRGSCSNPLIRKSHITCWTATTLPYRDEYKLMAKTFFESIFLSSTNFDAEEIWVLLKVHLIMLQFNVYCDLVAMNRKDLIAIIDQQINGYNFIRFLCNVAVKVFDKSWRVIIIYCTNYST